MRYGLGDPGAVPAERAIRWAGLAIEWAEAEVHPREDESGTDQLEG